jgi:hypothetical protein
MEQLKAAVLAGHGMALTLWQWGYWSILSSSSSSSKMTCMELPKPRLQVHKAIGKGIWREVGNTAAAAAAW